MRRFYVRIIYVAAIAAGVVLIFLNTAPRVALDAMQASREPHAFLGISGEGMPCVVRTRGNPDVHLVMRGGSKPRWQDWRARDRCLTRKPKRKFWRKSCN